MNEYSYSYTTYIVGLGPEVFLVRWRPTISQPVWEVLRLCYEIPGYVPTRHPLDTVDSGSQVFTSHQKSHLYTGRLKLEG